MGLFKKAKEEKQIIEVIPAEGEDYTQPAEDILDMVQHGEIKAGEGEALMMAIVAKDGGIKMAGYGDKAQVISIAFNLIAQAAGLQKMADGGTN